MTALATAALLSGGLGLAAGTAQADSACSTNNYPNLPASCGPPEGRPQCDATGLCSQLWCPNIGPMRRMPDWDMTVCHTYYFQPNSGLPAQIIQGEPPGPPPPPRPPCIAFVNCLPGL